MFVYRIPAGTSQELVDLLNGLLKRNARDRMDFETFFNHPFIRMGDPSAQKAGVSSGSSPVPMPATTPNPAPPKAPGHSHQPQPAPSPPLGESFLLLMLYFTRELSQN